MSKKLKSKSLKEKIEQAQKDLQEQKDDIAWVRSLVQKYESRRIKKKKSVPNQSLYFKVFETVLANDHGPQRIGTFLVQGNLDFSDLIIHVNGKLLGTYAECLNEWLLPTAKVELFKKVPGKV